jgi:integrase
MPKLTAAGVLAAHHSGRSTAGGKVRPERVHDGEGLYLQLAPGAKGGSLAKKSWLFRYSLGGAAREMGLGRVFAGRKDETEDDRSRRLPREKTLAEARDAARRAHGLAYAGIDPMQEIGPRAVRERNLASRRAEAEAAKPKGKTFREVARLYLDAHGDQWKNPKHLQQWKNTIATYALPHFGDRPVAEVDTAAVLEALNPIWKTKTETATRLRQRIEAVLSFATPLGWRSGENPARWKGHLDAMLAKPGKIAKVRHHPALPWGETGAFMALLRQREGVAARALEFCILTAARVSEVRGARWSEMDLAARVWNVPAARMKSGREHRVPLAPAALAVLEAVAPLRDAEDPDPLVFPGRRAGKTLSENTPKEVLKRMGRDDLTAHGFRSTFCDWAAEHTQFPRELAEKALSHVLADETEAAYQRGDMLARRAKLMDAWAAYCAKPAKAAEVVTLRTARG